MGGEFKDNYKLPVKKNAKNGGKIASIVVCYAVRGTALTSFFKIMYSCATVEAHAFSLYLRFFSVIAMAMHLRYQVTAAHKCLHGLLFHFIVKI